MHIDITSVDSHRLPRHPGFLEHYQRPLTEASDAQFRAIESLDGMRSLFNFPFPTNYVLSLIPRRERIEDLIRRVRKASGPLNRADQALHQWCAAQAKALDEPALSSAMADWKRELDAGSNLNSVFHASRVMPILKRNLAGDEAAPGWLTRLAPELCNAFLHVPDSVRGVRRLNIYLPEENELTALGALLGHWQNQPDQFEAIERVEIAQHGLRSPLKGSYPKLIIYLRDPVEPWPIIERISEQIAPQWLATEHEEEYAYSIRDGITYTEGFRLYKRYLNLLGLLDQAYDSGRNYAFQKAPY